MNRIICMALIIPAIAISSEKKPSHFDIPKPRSLQMVIANESLRLFGDLELYERDATENYFNKGQKIDPSTLCARFILKELGDLQYCKYVPVYNVLHQKTLITTLYELNLVADSSGTDPHDLIEKLCTRYTGQKQGTDEKKKGEQKT